MAGEAKDTSAGTPLDPIIRKSVEGGLITRGSISENDRPNNSVEESINFDFDTIGAAVLRRGTLPLGPSLNTNSSTDVGMVYGPTHGKFNQGAGFLTTSVIDFGNFVLPIFFSYSVWFRTTQTGASTDPALINFTGNYILGIDKTSHQLKFTSNTNHATAGPVVNDGNWHHAAVTFNTTDGSGELYLDGQPIASFSGFFHTTGSSDFLAGATSPSGGSNQYNGDMDDLAWFNRQISYLDVQALFANELVNTYLISDPTLFLYAQFEGNSNNNIAPILGMHYYVDTLNNGKQTKMIVVVGTEAWYWVDGITFSFWTAFRTGLTQAQKARFCTFLNDIFMVNGADATVVWDGIFGDSVSTVGNATGAPVAAFIENFQTRIWLAGKPGYPDRLYYSTVPSGAGPGTISTTNGSGAVTGSGTEFTNLKVGDTITIASGETHTITAISSDTSLTTDNWSTSNSAVSYTTTPIISFDQNPATGQWIDISPSDGESITGLQRFRSKMLVFKTNHIYRVFGVTQTDPDPWYPVGTYCQESVVETKVGVFFHHSSGFYMYDVNDIVQEISRPIIDIVKAIPPSSYPAVTGYLEPDGDHICWSVGNVVVRNKLFKNLVVRFSISTQVWTHRVGPTQFVASLRRAPLFSDGNTQYAMVGDTAGNVLKTNTGTTDNGAPIEYSLIHAWENMDGLLSTRKNVMSGMFSHYGGSGSAVSYQVEQNDPDDLDNWTDEIGTLSERNTGFNSINIKSRKMRFRVSGSSTGQQFFYHGYELIGVQDEIYQFTNGQGKGK